MSRGTRDRPLFGRLAGEVAVHRPDGMEMHRFVREPDIETPIGGNDRKIGT